MNFFSILLFRHFQSLKLFFLILVFVFPNLVFSQNIQNYESYYTRPDILTLSSQKHDLGDSWLLLRAAHFSFVAQLLAVYPKNVKIFFLARDSELLYDAAKLVTQGTPDFHRIGLLNISRVNMRHSNIMPYLAQNGITEKNLSNGQIVLLVDTGFTGTIPNTISEYFSNSSSQNLKTHLITSLNLYMPSSRAFLIHLNPSANRNSPSFMHGSIVQYEHLPRFTERSDQFVLRGGVYHALSPIEKMRSDGPVSKEESIKYMQDLKAYWDDPKNKKQFHNEKEKIEWLISLLSKPKTENSITLLKDALDSKDFKANLIEAHIRDLFEVSERNKIIQISDFQIQDLGLEVVQTNTDKSKKNEYKKLYPEWTPILEDPETHIPKLINSKNWQLIGALIDADIDVEFNILLAKYLFNKPTNGPQKALQILMIEKYKEDVHWYLAENVFSKPYTANMQDILKILIENANSSTLLYLIRYAFSQPHTQNMEDLLKLIIEKADPVILTNLAQFTFSKPHTQNMEELIEMTIEKGNEIVLSHLAEHTFSKPHTQYMHKQLAMIIEKGDSLVLQRLAQYTFPTPHTLKMKELLEKLIEKSDNTTLSTLAFYTFSQPHTQNMEDLLKLIIEKADHQVLSDLILYVFSLPHTQNMQKLLRIIIEKSDASHIDKITKSVFSKRHTQNSNYDILKEAIKIEDPNQRFQFLKSQTFTKNLNSEVNQEISVNLKPGDSILIKKSKFKVLKEIGRGKRSIVFQIENQRGEVFALKVAKNNTQETLKSISKEKDKARKWKDLGLPHSKVLFQAEHYVLKTWIDGLTGAEILITHHQKSTEESKLVFGKLSELIKSLIRNGAYIGDFRPPNLIWTGQQWTLIDSGSIKNNLSVSEAKELWNAKRENGDSKFESRWNIPLPQFSCQDYFN